MLRTKPSEQTAIGNSCHDAKLYLFQFYVKSNTQTLQTTALKHPNIGYNAICYLLKLRVSGRHHLPVFLKMYSIFSLDHQQFKLLDCIALTCFKWIEHLLFLHFSGIALHCFWEINLLDLNHPLPHSSTSFFMCQLHF